ncbi:MAG: hypothetical protein R6X02_00205 [Enhygromyxa sp.]
MSVAHPLLTHATMTMVLVDPGADPAAMPLAGIVEVLAQTIQAQLGDRSWVLRVVWDTGAPPSTPPSQIPVPTATPDVGAFVNAWLMQFCEEWGFAFDQVLIETSGVNPNGSLNADMWWAMDGLDCTASVNYLFDEPEVWHELPAALGLLPASVTAQPVALLGPLPEAQIVRTLLVELLQIISASNPVQEAQLWLQDAFATQRFRRWLRRWAVVVSQIYGSTRHVPQPWPINAVRLRFEDDPSVLSPPNETNEQSFGRWGRALTERRVGVALGGSGAQSYVALPFIEQLLDEGVPIDLLSGSSTGTFAAAFYAALGQRGLTRMLFNSGTIGLGVFMAYVTNIPLTWWMSWGTNFVDLSEVGQPVISVSSVADSGEPYYQTAGLAGKGMMASGSLPPFVATYIGNTRLLDGGLTDDLPTAMLQTAGAELVLAVQAIPKLAEIPSVPEQIPLPYPTKWWISFNPLVRTIDFVRGYVMVFRQAAVGSEQYAQVSYNATTQDSFVGSWYAGPRIAYEAATSQALKDAIASAKVRWQELLAGPRGRVRLNLSSRQVEVGPRVDIRLEQAPNGDWRLTPDAEVVLAVAGEFVMAHGSTLEVTLIDVPSAVPYPPLFEAASGLSSAQITYANTSPAASPPTFTLAIP